MPTNKKKKGKKRECTKKTKPSPIQPHVDEIIPRSLPMAITDDEKKGEVSRMSNIDLDEDQWEFV